MFNGFCHFGNWSSVGSFGVWVWVGWILHLVFWVGLFAGLSLLVIWALQRARSSAMVPSATGQPAAKEIVQTRYARGEITREQYQQMLDELTAFRD